MIHYIVALWLGPRRVQPVNNPYAYLRHQLYFLKNSKSIDKATFVVNHYDTELEKQIEPIIASFGVKANVIYRKNLGCSWGAFQEGVIQNLENDYDYHFLIEDDYKPTDDNFLLPYLNEMREDTVYSNVIGTLTSLTIGLLSNKWAKKMYSERGILFNLRHSTSYKDCEWNQDHFLDHLKEIGKIARLKNSCWYQWHCPFPVWIHGKPGYISAGPIMMESDKFKITRFPWMEGKCIIAPVSVWQTYHKLL